MVTRLTGFVSLALEQEERDFVLGDVEERGGNPMQSLRDVIGLVLRRQAMLWAGPMPWLTLVCCVVPLAVLLTIAAKGIADGNAIFLWFYTNNSDRQLLQSGGFWMGLLETLPHVVVSSSVLFCWSWTSGLLLAMLSRRTLWFHAVLCCFALLAIDLLGVPPVFEHVLALQRARDFSGNRAVFDVIFYRAIFPLLVQSMLVLFPMLWGSLQRVQFGRSSVSQIMLWLATLVTLSALALQNSLWWQGRAFYHSTLYGPRLPSLLPLAFLAPLAYFVRAVAVRRLQQRQTALQ